MYKAGHFGMANLLFSPIAGILAYTGYYPHIAISWVVFLYITTIPDYDLKVTFVKHRGITHTLFFAIISGIITSILFTIGHRLLNQNVPMYYVIVFGDFSKLAIGLYGFSIGFLSIIAHLLADIITPTGIKPLQPFNNKKYTLDITKAANPVANVLLLIGGGIALIGAISLGIYLSGGITISTISTFILPG